jgi:orotate phosphoribosyltransferase
MNSKLEIASILLNMKALHLNPDNHFTWSSGIKSPIYCDNRKVISFVDARKLILNTFLNLIKSYDKKFDVIVGTATAGIPWASWIADHLNLPLLYVRTESKSHGLKNAIEGFYEPKQKCIIIEDLVSTGKSAIATVNQLRSQDLIVENVVSIFSYQFDIAAKSFLDHNLSNESLSDLDSILSYALNENFLTLNQIESIKQWRTQVNIT